MFSSILNPKSEDYSPVTWNAESGHLEDPLLNNLRVMIIDADFYKALRDNLYTRFQSGASLILYEMGRGYGEVIAKTIKQNDPGRLEIYRKFMDRGKRQGYGEFRVPLLQSIISGLRGEAKVVLKDSFFASASGQTGHKECWIIAGMIAGAGSKILKRDVVCVEELCISKEDPHCEFRLKSSA